MATDIFGPPQTGVHVGTDHSNDPLKIGTVQATIKRDDPLKTRLLQAWADILLEDRSRDAERLQIQGVIDRDYRTMVRPKHDAYDSPE